LATKRKPSSRRTRRPYTVPVLGEDVRLARSTGQGYLLLHDAERGCKAKRYVGKLVEQDADGNPIGDPFPEAKERAARIIAEFRATSGGDPRPGKPEPLTVRQLAKSYLDERASEKSDDQLWHDQSALAVAIELYGNQEASQFGPLALRSVRKLMIDSGRLNRRTVNDRVARIVAAFAWAVSFEMIASEVLVALQTVKGLRAGRRDGLREPTPVRPVDDEDIEAVLPLLSPQLAAIIQVMRHSGARCGEVIQLRPCDLEQTADGLLYRPPSHKNAHRGHERVISLGPRAAQALKPFLLRPADRPCFSPAEAEEARLAARNAARVVPGHVGNVPGSNRSDNPTRVPGETYTTASVRRAIQRACNKLGIPTWTPHQVRHTFGTKTRKTHGIEVAKVLLGHKDFRSTTIYAEADLEKAQSVMREIG